MVKTMTSKRAKSIVKLKFKRVGRIIPLRLARKKS